MHSTPPNAYDNHTDIFGREITIHTVIYGVYIRFWPTLCIWYCLLRCCSVRAHEDVSHVLVCVSVWLCVHVCVGGEGEGGGNHITHTFGVVLCIGLLACA